jgi:hypothetical protein
LIANQSLDLSHTGIDLILAAVDLLKLKKIKASIAQP